MGKEAKRWYWAQVRVIVGPIAMALPDQWEVSGSCRGCKFVRVAAPVTAVEAEELRKDWYESWLAHICPGVVEILDAKRP